MDAGKGSRLSQKLVVREEPATVAVLERVARSHGLSVASEVRIAIRRHLETVSQAGLEPR
jgi:hypothetical protein